MKTKRLFSAILAACLTLALILPTSAAGTAPSLDDAVQAVTALGILNGDGSGNLNLSARVTRAEFVAMAVKATPGGDGVGQAATSPYSDVPRSHWASGYVEAAPAAVTPALSFRLWYMVSWPVGKAPEKSSGP